MRVQKINQMAIIKKYTYLNSYIVYLRIRLLCDASVKRYLTNNE